HDQIKISVAVDVGESGSGRGLVGARHTGGCRDVLEAPVSEVAVERVGRIEAAEVEIAESVAIDVTRGDAGPVEEDLVGQRAFLIKTVREGDANACRVHQDEARSAMVGE